MAVSQDEELCKVHWDMCGIGEKPDLYNVESAQAARAPKLSSAQERIEPMRMRTNIAVAFMKTRTQTGGTATITQSNLREAFNSPFRPFVLITTSVGQEGLDFHQYCRRVCHWNLPSNPIDLEQREGRVNRYQGLSVRQGVAARYGNMSFKKEDGPVWAQVFLAAKRSEDERAGDKPDSGLLPNWGVTQGDDLVPVERYAYLYPFSRDKELYDSLIEQLYRYRMVIGQPNQEGLLRMLGERIEAGALGEYDASELYVNLCPFVTDARR